MFDDLIQIAFIGPGGPEVLIVMLVLLLMFGAKDAPRIFRKMNELLNKVRNTADSFKREVMYGDLNNASNASSNESDHEYDEEYDYEADYNEAEFYGEDDVGQEEKERGDSNEPVQSPEKDLEDELKSDVHEPDPAVQTAFEKEDGDAPKT